VASPREQQREADAKAMKKLAKAKPGSGLRGGKRPGMVPPRLSGPPIGKSATITRKPNRVKAVPKKPSKNPITRIKEALNG